MPELDGIELMREMIRVFEEHFAPLRATLLDGTISCQNCGALVLQENANVHAIWHDGERMRNFSGL